MCQERRDYGGRTGKVVGINSEVSYSLLILGRYLFRDTYATYHV